MNDRLDELIALAALGELTAEETTELDARLVADPAAAGELAEALDVAATLQSFDAVEPPPDLRAKVLASIASMEQLPVEADAGAGGTPSPPSSTAAPDPVLPRPVDLDEARRRRRVVSAVAAAAAVVLIVIGGIVVANRNDDASDDPIAAVLEADDVTTRPLEGSLGTLEMAYSAEEGAMVVTGDDVPPIPADETYQLWMVDETGAVPAGTFRPDDSGHVGVRVDADPSGSVVGVTLEPSGGSEQPTLPMLASA
jgi:anti-sigma factor RsiW